jgi:hypothetical protein
MSAVWKGAVSVAVLAILAIPLAGAAANPQPKKHYRRHFATACPLHRTAEGELVDCRGWRLRDNATGWDNSCFNLDYLPSQFACGARGRR